MRIVTDAGRLGASSTEGDLVELPPLHVLAHELRGPMTPLLASTGLFQDLVRDDLRPEAGLLAANIQRGAEQLLEHIDELLEIVALQRGHTQPSLATSDAAAVLAEAGAALGAQAREREQRIDIRLPQSPLPARADANRLRQALRGMLDVALRRSLNGTAVEARAHTDAQSVIVEITRPGTQSAEEDSSLGLSLARAVAAVHSGGLAVTQGEGKVVYRLTMPAAAGREAA